MPNSSIWRMRRPCRSRQAVGANPSRRLRENSLANPSACRRWRSVPQARSCLACWLPDCCDIMQCRRAVALAPRKENRLDVFRLLVQAGRTEWRSGRGNWAYSQSKDGQSEHFNCCMVLVMHPAFAKSWSVAKPGPRFCFYVCDNAAGELPGGRTANDGAWQRAVSEALGTAFLLATVIGSGIMAQRLAGGNGALALLCNTLPTGAILTVPYSDLRPGIRRSFQSGRERRICATRGASLADGLCLYRRAALRRGDRRVGRAPNVRTSGVAIFNHDPDRLRPMARRGRRYVWSFANDLRLRCASAGCGRIRRGPLHYGRLLVSLRQPHLRILR